MQREYFFECYGQKIKSCFDLSLLGLKEFKNTKSKDFDLEICLLNSTINQKNTVYDNQTSVSKDRGYYYRKGIAYFEFIDGKIIKVFPFTDSINHDFIRILLNFPLACILFQKGFFLLHASAIRYKEKTIIFPGIGLSGKSTIVGKLIKDGGRLITEDTAVIKIHKEGNIIYPSYPMIKISDEANKAIKFSNKKGIVFSNESSGRKGYLLKRADYFHKDSVLDYCIFPKWIDGEAKLLSINAGPSMSKLLESSLAIFPLDSLREKEIFKNNISFLKELNCYQFQRKRDFSEISKLSYFIDRLADEND